MTTRKFQIVFCMLLTLLIAGCTITVRTPASESPLRIRKIQKLTAATPVSATPNLTATATVTPTAAPTNSPTPSPTATRTPRPTLSAPTLIPTPTVPATIVPSFPPQGYPEVNLWINLPSQRLHVHFVLHANGDYDVHATVTKPDHEEVTLTLCQFLEFERKLGYVRPSSGGLFANAFVGCQYELHNPGASSPHAEWREKDNLYNYFDAPPSPTPAQ